MIGTPQSPGAGEDILKALARLATLGASRQPLIVLLDGFLRFVEQLTPDMRCSILLTDLSAKVLRSGAAPSLPVAYTRAIDGLPIADGIGSCGTAAARRETVIVGDIARSPLWRDYTSLAKAHGLAACWSVPLLDSNGELLGTCAMYYSQPRIPTPNEEDLIRITGSLAALAIQRHRDAERLQASEARYRQLTETCPDAILVHSDGCIVYANRAAADLLHLASPETMIAQRLDRFVNPECQRVLSAHRAGVLASTLHCSDGASVQVDIVASQISMDGHMRTLLVCRDMTERLMLEHELLDVASREQAHLAHDLHDGLGQQLTGIALFLRGLGNQIVRELPAHAADFEQINGLVSKSIEEARRLASGMSPIAVHPAGLAGALSTLSAQARELYGLQVTLEIDPLFHTLIENRVASQLYRIVQEAVNNVVRHAHATTLTITAHCAGSELILTIADDGIGVAESPQASDRVTGMGLRIMRYRAEQIGGTFRIDRCSPHGTAIRVSCPLKEEIGNIRQKVR
jgi:two-component system, LuxR family, sensor kinase FixL